MEKWTMVYFLTLDDDRVVVSYGDAQLRVATVTDFQAFMEAEAKRVGVSVSDLHVFASSKLESPQDVTNNAETIALAKALSDHCRAISAAAPLHRIHSEDASAATGANQWSAM